MDSHKVTAKGYVNNVNGQMVSISAIFTSTNHTKQPNPWPNSSANRIANYSWLCACLGERKPFKEEAVWALVDIWQAIVKVSWVTFSTNACPNCCTAIVWWRTCCCVRGRWIFSNPVTNRWETLILCILYDKVCIAGADINIWSRVKHIQTYSACMIQAHNTIVHHTCI